MDFIIDNMKAADWGEVSGIYLEGINTKIATFQSELPSWETWDAGHCKPCRLVARSEGRVLGWAAMSPISSRCVYAGVADISVYTGEKFKGLGVGTALLNELIRRSEEEGFWTLQSHIIKENTASRVLHLKCGFREVGIWERLGRMDNGKWHDVVIMEHRSKIVG